jgi:hypothetical protein
MRRPRDEDSRDLESVDDQLHEGVEVGFLHEHQTPIIAR